MIVPCPPSRDCPTDEQFLEGSISLGLLERALEDASKLGRTLTQDEQEQILRNQIRFGWLDAAIATAPSLNRELSEDELATILRNQAESFNFDLAKTIRLLPVARADQIISDIFATKLAAQQIDQARNMAPYLSPNQQVHAYEQLLVHQVTNGWIEDSIASAKHAGRPLTELELRTILAKQQAYGWESAIKLTMSLLDAFA